MLNKLSLDDKFDNQISVPPQQRPSS